MNHRKGLRWFLAAALLVSYGAAPFALPAQAAAPGQYRNATATPVEKYINSIEKAAGPSVTWTLDDQLSGAEAGALLPAFDAAQTGIFSAKTTSDSNRITVRKAGDGTSCLYAEVEDSANSYSPNLVLNLDEAYAGGTLTADLELLVEAGSQLSWMEFGFGTGESVTAPPAMVTGQITGASNQLDWTSIAEGDKAHHSLDTWYRYHIVTDLDAKAVTLTVSNEEGELGTMKKGFDPNKSISSLRQFLLYPRVDGSSSGREPDRGAYRIRKLTVSYTEGSGSTSPIDPPDVPASGTPGADPFTQGPAWTAPEDAEKTWILNEQIKSAQAGDALPLTTEAQPGAFAAFYGSQTASAATCLTVRGEGDQRYVEIKYDKANERLPLLALTLPESYRSGTLQADYKLYMLPHSAPAEPWPGGQYWHDSGFGTEALVAPGQDGYAVRVLHNQPGYVDPGSGWSSVNRPFREGGWYRYRIAVDLSRQTVRAEIYTPTDEEPTAFEYPLGANAAKEISRFVVKPYDPEAGVLCVKDAAVSYIPADRDPKPLAPANGVNMITVKPTFSWTNTGAESYRLEISKSGDFSTGVTTVDGLTATSYTPGEALDYYAAYYWRVTASYDGGGDRRVSPVWHLKTEIQDTPDNVYEAGSYGLTAGDWQTSGGTVDLDTARRNASIIQGLLDKAGRAGGGTVILPEGTYCLAGDYNVYASRCLYINYDNLTLTGAGKDADGNYKTILRANAQWDGPNKIFRSGGITIVGEPWNSGNARKNIEISHFEMDGGRGWTGNSDWGYEQDIDYGWDISHQGIVVSKDDLVTHVTLDDLYVHSFSGETLYVGGKYVGYLEVKNCTLADTNASCFNLYAAYLNVHDNQFGSPDGRCRFWIEYCPRASGVDEQYRMPSLPAGIEKDTAHIYNNTFYNSVNAHGIAIAQGDCTKYTMLFENNVFDNALDTNRNGIFQLAGAVYGPTILRSNVIRNTDGPVLVFSYGGGTVDENGVPNVDWMLNKNIILENNVGENLAGPIVDLMGSWGVWDPTLDGGKGGAAPAVQPVEDLFIRNNHFTGANPGVQSVAIGNFAGTVESAIDLKGVEITGNTFENCVEPQEIREFLGNAPLFRDNVYTGTTTPVAVLDAGNTLLRPIYETLAVKAAVPVAASIRTGRNEDGQMVEVLGAAGTAPVTFPPAGAGYTVPQEIILHAGDRLTLQYNAAAQVWQYVSYQPKAVTPPAGGAWHPGAESAPPAKEFSPGEALAQINSNSGPQVNLTPAPSDTLDGQLFTAAQKAGKDLLLAVTDESGSVLYTWSFGAESLLLPQISVNLAIRAMDAADAGAEWRPLLGSASGRLLSFSHSGLLPGKAIIAYPVKELYADGALLNYYRLDARTGRVQTVAEGLPVQNGQVLLPQERCSEYLLTPDRLPDAEPPASANPGTGDSPAPLWALLPLAAAGLLLAARRRLGRSA